MRKNNKGYTLVELMISVVLFVLIFLQVLAFMQSSQKFYKKGVGDISLQTEAQQVIRQLEELMIDAQVSINVVHKDVASASSYNGLTDNPVTNSGLYQTVNIGEAFEIEWNDKTKYSMELVAADGYQDFGNLMCTVYERPSPSDAWTKKGETEVLGEYINNITIDKGLGDSFYDQASRINLSVSMNNSERAYEVSKDLYLRNDLGKDQVKSEPIGDAEGYLKVLRCKTYDLTKLFPREDGSSYAKYVMSAGSANYETGEGGVLVGGKLKLNKNACSITNFDKGKNGEYNAIVDCYLKATDTTPAYTIKIEVEAVEVGAKDLTSGHYVGFFYCYTGSTETTRFTYVPVLGISLENATVASCVFQYPDRGAYVKIDPVECKVKPEGVDIDEQLKGGLGSIQINCMDGKYYKTDGGLETCLDPATNSIIVKSKKWLDEQCTLAHLFDDLKATKKTTPVFQYKFTFPAEYCASSTELLVDVYFYPVIEAGHTKTSAATMWEVFSEAGVNIK